MLRRLRENGPVLLVPLAWTFATAAHLDLLELRTVLIAHLVMDSIIAAFTVLSWREMRSGVLLAWRRVLVVGLGVTLVGTAGLSTTPPSDPLLVGTVVGWMLVPTAGLAYTGRHVDRHPRVYTVGAALSGAGAVAYLGGVCGSVSALAIAGLALTNVGQTAGIVAAVYDY
jgi:FtsH-binding integral membrane protein